MKDYQGESGFDHREIPAVGIVVANLGTPDAPTTPALRRYLREFLSDPRVIELPRWKWQIILNLFILTTRPQKSAAAYRTVWTDEGSPLLLTSRRQTQALERKLRERFGSPIHCELGMRYGNPSIASAVEALAQKGCRKMLLFPLYPQYSATTTASTFDAFSDALQKRRWIPEVRTVNSYDEHPGYIAALASTVREAWDTHGEPDKLVMSFHGIPRRYFLAGDPYHCFCHRTGRLVAEALGLTEDRYEVTFQSRFGREPWLEPYTDRTLQAWAKNGLKKVHIMCPGFSSDCLETIEEINVENRGYFTAAGGESFHYIPALNDRDDHIEALADVATQHIVGWAQTRDEWSDSSARERAEATERRARKLEADGHHRS